MTFVHVAFLGGILAVAVPIVLHLIMRQQPKHLEFPALRFIKLREQSNRRQLRLRHWLLLALRALALCLLAFALARPSILASGMLGDQEAPAAVALVFDTNPRMQYRQQNQTRLQLAQDTARWLLTQLPPDSEVSVVDSRHGTAAFAVDLGAARQRIERLDALLATEPLSLAFESALKLVSESEKPRKEVYVFTDLSRAAWTPEKMRELERQFQQSLGVGIYVIDVGANEPSNCGLGELHLSGDVLSKNSPLHIETDLVHAGPQAERAVELYLIDSTTGRESLRGKKNITFRPGESERAQFELRSLGVGVHQGTLKLVGEDPLSVDDVRWFTVEVRPAWRVLIAAPRDAKRQPKDYAFFLSEALAPYDLRVRGETAFECDIVSTDELAQKRLEDYSAVCLVDPRPLAPETWQRLHSYVVAGGGLGIFLGRNAMPVAAFNAPIAQQLLPAPLMRQWKSAEGLSLAPDSLEHPILSRFRSLGSSVAWGSFPVFRHWQLGPLSGDVAVVLPYSNNQPAILDRPVGKGRVITMTTPISDPASGDTWNVIPTGEEPLPFFILAHGMLNSLVGSGQQRLNYMAADTAVVQLGTGERHPFYSLSTPRGDQLRTPPDERQNALVITSTEAAGNYRIQAGGGGEQGANLGFSVNLPPEVSQLDRASAEDLKTIFGDTPFRLARNRDEIDRSVSAGRVGQELFPYLMVLLAVILGFEQVLSNRFYHGGDTREKVSAAAKFVGRKGAKAAKEDAVTAST